MIKYFFIISYQVALFFKKVFVYVCKELTLIHKTFIIIVSVIILYSSLPILLFDDFNITYKSYQNIDVIIKDYKINGRLNNHTTIRQINNDCYKIYCGLYKSGGYELSSITFIDISSRGENIYSLCLKNGECFYNIDDEFIENRKLRIARSAKWGILEILAVILGALFQIKMEKYFSSQKKSKEE